MQKRVYNFSPGPAVLPLSVLEEAQRDLVSLPGVGCSALEVSHRSPWFDHVLAEAEANLRELLAIPPNYRVLFVQGGARLQFSLVPLNLLRGTGRGADYLLTGSWSKMAVDEARREGSVRTAWSGKATNFDRLPTAADLQLDAQAAYLYFTSNETIQGVQFLEEPAAPRDVPLVCDASSDFLCRPLDMNRYGLLFACAQKNAGPAGVTVVIVREDLLARSGDDLHTMLSYRLLADNKSLLNTPPVFATYVLMLVTRWLRTEIGGLDKMLELNRAKARLLYDVVDAHPGFYQGHARPECRSLMNVTFRLPDEATQKRFFAAARERDLHSLEGHRSVGGVRASIYNAMPRQGVEALAELMREFAAGGG